MNNWGGARKGAGRKPTGRNPVKRKNVNITVSCLPVEKQQIVTMAKTENKTISDFVIGKVLGKDNTYKEGKNENK